MTDSSDKQPEGVVPAQHLIDDAVQAVPDEAKTDGADIGDVSAVDPPNQSSHERPGGVVSPTSLHVNKVRNVWNFTPMF